MVTMVKKRLDFHQPFPLTPTPMVDGDTIFALDKASECVCEAFGVTIAGLRGRSRERRFVYPRHALAALISEVYNTTSTIKGRKMVSSAVIGWYLRKAHCTVLNSKKAHGNLMSYEDRTYEPYYQIAKAMFKAHANAVGGIEFLNKRISDIDYLTAVLNKEKAAIQERLLTINSTTDEDMEDLCPGTKF